MRQAGKRPGPGRVANSSEGIKTFYWKSPNLLQELKLGKVHLKWSAFDMHLSSSTPG